MNYERLYEYRFRDIDQGSRAAVWGEIAPFIHEVLGRPRIVLDPAAGRGEFINAVPAQERCAVDMVDYPEGTHAPGTQVVVSDIFLPEGHFDGVWISNFLEHLLSQEDCARFRGKLPPSPAGTRRYLRSLAAWRLLGKQFLVVA